MESVPRRSESGGVIDFRSACGWNVSYRSVSHGPAPLLSASALALWAAAETVGPAHSRRPGASPSQPAFVALRSGEQEASVITALGPAPDSGDATRLDRVTSSPCLPYPLSTMVGRFRNSRHALRHQPA